MNDASISEQIKNNSNFRIYFLSMYFIAVGSLYLWGYWTPFGVNILEYITLADIVKSTAYPIASVFISFAVGVVSSELSMAKKYFPHGGGSETVAGRFFRKHRRSFVIFYSVATIALLVWGPIEKWFVLPMLAALPIVLYAKEHDFLAKQIPAEAPRNACLFLVATLPFLAFGFGKIEANSIIEGKAFYYVIDNITATPSLEPIQRNRFVGHAGDFLFVWEPKSSTLSISKFDTGKVLRLRKYDRKISSRAISTTSQR